MAKVNVKNWIDPEQVRNSQLEGYAVTVSEANLVRLESGIVAVNFEGQFSYNKTGKLKSSAVEKMTIMIEGKEFAEVTEFDPVVFTGVNTSTYNYGGNTVTIEKLPGENITKITVTNGETGETSITEITTDLFYSNSTQSPNWANSLSQVELPDLVDILTPVSEPTTAFDLLRPFLNGADEIIGTLRSDTLMGGNESDSLLGRGGKDKLYGEAGDDLLKGGQSRDMLNGGDGDDRLIGGEGNDKLIGMDGNDQLIGGNDNDLLWGRLGSDDLQGNKGSDVLFGGAGEDQLRRGTGKDLVVGGRDDDLLSGGAGADRFVFEAGDGQDVITDFLRGGDVLDLSDFGFDDLADVLGLASDNGERTIIELSETDRIVLRNTVLEDLDETVIVV